MSPVWPTPLWKYSPKQDPSVIQRILHHAKTVAIVGLSRNALRASYFVGYYLRRHGYRIVPVNPRETEILGEPCFASLHDVPVPVDVVNDPYRTPHMVVHVFDTVFTSVMLFLRKLPTA